MFLLFLLFTQAFSASQSSNVITSSTFFYQDQHIYSGSVLDSTSQLYYCEVYTSAIHMLGFDLDVWQGDADLYVFALVNGMEVAWSSVAGGSDYLSIMQTDFRLAGDGMGLQRVFYIYVYGFSTGISSYTLTITAYGASEWKLTSKESIQAYIAARRNEALLTVTKYEGDTIRHIETSKAAGIGSSWLGAMGGVVLLGLGILVWRKREGRQEKDAYRLI
jgi:LPXTG-motif cell wall-anchored protein